MSDIHLVERHGAWLLTLSARLVAAIADVDASNDASPIEGFLVHVEPNLLPGEPFQVALCIAAPAPDNDDVPAPR